MNWMKYIFISLGVLVIVGAGGYFGYQAAYAIGETAGYDIGYPAGEEAGYSSGKQDGYDEGYSAGEQDGYDEGYSSGRQNGYDEGYSSGRGDGYEGGYDAGETEGYISGKTDGYSTGYDEGIEAGLGHGYTLKDPTYAEVVAFLREDKTDENEYIEDTYGVYVCSHFTRDVCNNAEQVGFRCALVELRYPEQGHVIIAFDTIDEGLVYFEPQSDERAKPATGKRYYQCIIPEAGYYYEEPSYDDTIMDIVVVW